MSSREKMNAKVGKKMNRFMKFAMGLTISVFLATYGVVASGHFTFKMWGLSLLLSIALTLIISLIVPVNKIAEGTAEKFKFKFVRKLVSNFIINLIYVFVITTVLTCVMLTMANRQISTKIDNKKAELSEINEEIGHLESEIEGVDRYSSAFKSLNTELGENQDKAKELEGAIKGLEKDKPSIIKTLPKSLLMSFVISYIMSLVLQPIYLMLAKRRYIPKPSADDLE